MVSLYTVYGKFTERYMVKTLCLFKIQYLWAEVKKILRGKNRNLKTSVNDHACNIFLKYDLGKLFPLALTEDLSYVTEKKSVCDSCAGIKSPDLLSSLSFP